jgi:hypothetical protein
MRASFLTRCFHLHVEVHGYVAASPQQISSGSEMVFIRLVAVVPNMGMFTGVVMLENGGHAQR